MLIVLAFVIGLVVGGLSMQYHIRVLLKANRGLSKEVRRLSAIVEHRMPKRLSGTAPCERCKDEPKIQGIRRDPHYRNGPCILCDGTGTMDLSNFVKVEE